MRARRPSFRAEKRRRGRILPSGPTCVTPRATSSPQEQLSAVGRFHSPDLKILAEPLDSADSNAQRAGLTPFKLVVTHHSPSYGSDSGNGLCITSLQDLSSLCVKKDVKGLLTGHVHARWVTPKQQLPVETRCGTTTQRDWLRWKWAAQGRVRRGHPLDFLYHQFSDMNGGFGTDDNTVGLQWRHLQRNAVSSSYVKSS